MTLHRGEPRGAVARRAAALVGAVAVAATTGGCTRTPSHPAGSPALEVVPASTLLDGPFDVRTTGLRPGTTLTLTATSTDARRVRWTSTSSYAVDASGVVDLARDAPRTGDYSGVAAAGPLWSMRNGSAAAFFAIPDGGFAVTVTAGTGGRVVGAQTVRRLATAPGVTQRELRPARDGRYGVYAAPPPDGRRHPAVLLLGGSEGGLSRGDEARLLAAHGIPALALAYFAEPGLPPTLADIPLEQFAAALRWLAHRPGVDPHRLVVDGISRGSEAALLTAADYPRLVAAAVALVPSNVALCAPGCNAPAWTWQGKPIPYTEEFDNPQPDDMPAAVIPVERIAGPVFLDCGGADALWHSCTFARAIAARLHRAGRPAPTLLAFPRAGHLVGDLVPNLPWQDPELAGADAGANPRARAVGWPRLLAFLAGVPALR